MSDKDDIAARRRKEREEIKRQNRQNMKETEQARVRGEQAHDDAMDREIRDMFGMDFDELQNAADYASTKEDKSAIEEFIKAKKSNERGGFFAPSDSSVKRKGKKAKGAAKRAKAAKKKKKGWFW